MKFIHDAEKKIISYRGGDISSREILQNEVNSRPRAIFGARCMVMSTISSPAGYKPLITKLF